MNEEINNLKLEIEILKKRITELELIERRRQIVKIIKAVLITLIIIVIVIFAYKWYKEINDLYSEVSNFLNNPLKIFN